MTDGVTAELRAVYQRLFPARDATSKEFSDEILTLAAWFESRLADPGSPPG